MKPSLLQAAILPLLAPILSGDLLASSARDARAIWNRAVPEWADGPVRYSLSAKETAQYRSLRNPAERSSFIARFWASRNPEPSKPWNRSEEDFWVRVAVAQDSFRLGSKQGWETDRGWVYITLGPPNEITDRGPELQVWLYRALPNPRAPGNLSYTFVRDQGENYRLAGNTFLPARPGSAPGFSTTAEREGMVANPVSRPFAAAGPDHPAVPNAYDGLLSGGLDPLGAARKIPRGTEFSNLAPFTDLARGRGLEMDQAFLLLQAFPPALASTHVTSQEIYGNLLLRHRVDYLRNANGSIRVLVTLALPQEDLLREGFPGVPVSLTGTLGPRDGFGPRFSFGAEKSSDSDLDLQRISGDACRLFQISGVVAPGEYRLSLEARVGSKAGRTESSILVPDLTENSLAIGGPILADRFSVLHADSPSGDFDLGGFRVSPRLMPVYAAGESLSVYFQTYAAGLDDAGRTHLDFRYEVFRREHRSYRPSGTAVLVRGQSRPNHAFSFPLSAWIPGDYLIVVTAEDRVRGDIAAASATFEVR
ncbi:MAG TPA: GWxTD domain-containing protein [Candidatus Polarisedimenticolia bacterium]|nr:GWxTD domain-containing protein [Candidatus Polarisedimenticolia bacterium]